MKILVIEDDEVTGAYMADGLREEGHSVDLIDSGFDGLIRVSVGYYDVFIIDRMLPGIDGVSLVKTLRGAKNHTPVLFLTSLGGVDDKIEAQPPARQGIQTLQDRLDRNGARFRLPDRHSVRKGFGLPKVQSTPLRLTGSLFLIFTVSALISFAVAYGVVRSSFDVSLQEQIHQTMTNYRSADDAGDLLEQLRADASTTDPGILILQYWPDNGSRISNVNNFPPVTEFAIVQKSDINSPESELSDSYLANSSRVGSEQLVVAHTREQIVEMGEIFQVVFLIGLLPIIAMATAAGLFVARRANSKLDSIPHVLVDLTSGYLQARIKTVNGDRDDLTQISNAVIRMASAQEALVATLGQVSTDIAHDLMTPIQRVAVILEQVRNMNQLSGGQDVLLDRALD